MAKVILNANETFTVSSAAQVFGADGPETLRILGAPNVEVDQNVDRVELAGNVSDYTFKTLGNEVVIFSGAATVASIAVQDDANGTNDGTVVVFADGAASLKINALNTINLGGAAIPVGAPASAVVPSVFNASDKSNIPAPTFTLTSDAAAATPTLDGNVIHFTIAPSYAVTQKTTLFFSLSGNGSRPAPNDAFDTTFQTIEFKPGESAPQTVSVSVLGANEIWVADGVGKIGTVNADTGAIHNPISLLDPQNQPVFLTDIAFNPNGDLYGIDFGTLYRIDKATGATTQIGALLAGDLNAPTLNDPVNGLSFGPDGTLYASSENRILYAIDPDTAVATQIFDTGFTSGGDLAFHQGRLYYTDGTNLIFLDLAHNNAIKIGPIGASQPVFGLAEGDNGVLYAVAGQDVYAVDTLTGAGTLDSSYSGGLGLAFGAAFDSGPSGYAAKLSDSREQTLATLTGAIDETPQGNGSAPDAAFIVAFADDTGVSGDRITNDNTPTLSGFLVGASANVNIYDGGVFLGSAPVANGAWSFTGRPLSDGDHSFTAKAYDSAEPPFLGALFEFTGNGGSAGIDGSIYDKDIHSGAPRDVHAFPSLLVGPPVQSDSYVLQGGDPFGGDTGDDFEVTQAPGHAVVAGFDIYTHYDFNSSNGGAVPNPLNQVGTGIDGNPDTSWVEFKNSTGPTWTGTLTLSGQASGGQNFSNSGQVTLAPGESAYIVLNDESSNYGGYNFAPPDANLEGPASAPFTITIDATPPDMPILSSVDITDINAPVLSGTWSNGANETLQITIDDGLNQTPYPNPSLDGSNWRLVLPGPLPSGIFKVIAKTTDLAGNIATSTNVVGTAGDDSFSYVANDLHNNINSLNGLGGTDTLQILDAGLVLSDDFFSNVKNLEILELAGTESQSATLGPIWEAAFGDNSIVRATQASSLTVDASTVLAKNIEIDGTGNADTLKGGGGNDTITGNVGADDMTGGGGNDTFVIGDADSDLATATADVIQDFQTGQDAIKLSFAGNSSNFQDYGFSLTFGDDLSVEQAVIIANNNIFPVNIFPVPSRTVTLAYIYDDAGGTAGYLVVDKNSDHSADFVVKLAGLNTVSGLVFSDILTVGSPA
jgi:hypothetical protein